MRMLGSDAILRSLEAEGVEVAFGIPGGAILPTYDAFARGSTVRHVLTRHEQGAAYMALGAALDAREVIVRRPVDAVHPAAAETDRVVPERAAGGRAPVEARAVALVDPRGAHARPQQRALAGARRRAAGGRLRAHQR